MSTILVVEDNVLIRELIHEILAREHYHVLEASDGKDALEKLQEATPDLVLMDIQLPFLDGYAVLSQLRHNPRLSGLPVIALTAYAMHSDQEKAMQAGFDGYQTKPIDRAALLQMIRGFLTRGRSPSQRRIAGTSSTASRG
jgi:CheY-like chemotaxis protein